MENPRPNKLELPISLFPALFLSLLFILSGLFWFDTVVLNQFRNSHRHMSLTYASVEDVAKAASAGNSSLPASSMKTGQYQQAIGLLQTTIEKMRAAGRNGRPLADQLQAAGKCSYMLGKYSQAEEYYREALEIYNTLGKSYPLKLKREARRDYALVLKHLGQSERARKLDGKED